MNESEAYKTYYDLATGKVAPKAKYVWRSTREKNEQAPKASPGKRLKATAKVTKSGKKKLPSQILETLPEIALSEAEQMKIVTKRSKTQFYSSHASGSSENEGTGVSPGVPDVPTYGSEDEQISWKSSDKDDDDEVSMSKDDDDNADNQDDDGQDDENEQTESDNDGDDFVHPKFSTHDEEERQHEEDKEEEGNNVEREELDEEETNEEEETNVQRTRVIEDTHVIITAVNPEVQQQSSSVSSGFISNMLNPNPDTGIDFILNLNTKSTSLVDAPVTTNVEMPPSSVTTLPSPPIPLIQPLQQTPVSTPTISLSTSLQNLPTFGSLFKFEDKVKALEDDFSEFKRTNLFAETVSSIPSIVDKYLANQMNEAIKTIVQLQSDRLRSEAQADNEDFINKIDENMKKIIKEQVKIEAPHMHNAHKKRRALGFTALSLDKMKNNKSIDKSVQQKNLYKALVDAYESDKDILASYGDTVTLKRRQDDEDDDEEPFAGSNRRSKRRRARKEPESTNLKEPAHQEFDTGFTKDQLVDETTQLPDWFQKPTKPPTPDRDWNNTFPAVHGLIQPWISTLSRNEDPRESFNKLMDTPLDFSAFMLNRLKVDTLTPELLAGLTFELMKGLCKSLVELEYFLREPLPLIPNSRGRRAIPFDHFINNDLAYLSGGVLSRTYATSVTKTKVADYGQIKCIEDLVPNTIWINRESARDVYSRNKIIGIKKLMIIEWHNYKHLEWITVRRDDDKMYTFKECDYNRPRLQEIKDMLLLLVQGKLTNLNIEERLALGVSLRMFTRSIVIRRRVKDLQLGIKSYQEKLNLTKLDTYISDLKRKTPYTAYSNPKGFIYQNKDKKNRLMFIDELHKFSDGTLNDV
ncbi:hypothetical protein Tco_1022243 [Tanacetum coccineum]